MRGKFGVVVALALILVTSGFAATAKRPVRKPTGTLTTLYNFTCVDGDGCNPFGKLTADSKGNLWGMTNSGGANSDGTIFELVKSNNYAETVVHSFDYTDGAYPFVNELTFDKSGNLYGATDDGGANGYGTIFEITSSGTFNTLYTFSYSDGAYPYGGVIVKNGTLYGTTESGGADGYGTVYSLSGGTLTTIESFDYSNTGGFPLAGLSMDASGNLWGTCEVGGSGGSGTLFELTPNGSGWNFNLAHSWDYTDGGYPYGGKVVFAKKGKGAAFGTTEGGGTSGAGTVWQYKTNGTLNTVYNFTGSTDGGYPISAIRIDNAGHFYGTTEGGGNDYGTVFVVTHPKQGSWEESVVYAFSYSDGGYPYGTILDRGGVLYGTTYTGGTDGYGTVFSLKP